MRYEDLADYPCSITRPLVVLGDRWTFLILKFAFAGTRRFNGFQAELGISRGRLMDRLNRLVSEGIFEKRAADTGHHEEYRLTPKGHDLYTVLMAVKDWGDRYMAPDGPPVLYKHRNCDGEAHVALTCRECGAPLGARDIVPSAGPGLPLSATKPLLAPPSASSESC
ncbi:MAG: winged helix-turn-helix transcriptional regulator [Marmoricola sp.]